MPQTRKADGGKYSSPKRQPWAYNYKHVHDNVMTFYPYEVSVYLNHDLFQEHWLATES
jgi:hypothetical protein